MARPDGRAWDKLRPVRLELGVQKDPAGSALISCGATRVLCAASVSDEVPEWRRGRGRGWITAEYGMLPGAVPGRSNRDAGGRGREIQRLIGRSLRAAVDLERLGERMITVDCDVLQADGGTRTAAITGGWVALALAVRRLLASGVLSASPLLAPVSAVSCALLGGQVVLDPCYQEDHRAEVDANFVLDGAGRFVEVQATAEGAAFDESVLVEMLALARRGAAELAEIQHRALAT